MQVGQVQAGAKFFEHVFLKQAAALHIHRARGFAFVSTVRGQAVFFGAARADQQVFQFALLDDWEQGRRHFAQAVETRCEAKFKVFADVQKRR